MDRNVSGNVLIVLVSAFLLAFANGAFFAKVLEAYPLTLRSAPMLLSLLGVFGGATVVLLSLLSFKNATKPVLISFLVLAAIAAYFMDTFGVVINEGMLANVAATQHAEVRDLLSGRLFGYAMLLGVLPGLAIWRAPLLWRGWRLELLARLKLVAAALALVLVPIAVFGAFYASFFREHKTLRMYANPGYFTYSAIKLAAGLAASASAGKPTAIGLDARIAPADEHRELVILVIGETARADRFSLNGYVRETNPELRRAGVISFTDFHACGTSTAVSVPCMFMVDDGRGGGRGPGAQENLLDIAQRAGVNVLWRDNNSDSKGVALRTRFEDFRSSALNPACDAECRDEGMLGGLQRYVDGHPKGDILIVLHQMGNHGPAYFRRYPAQFERFTPVCKSQDLSHCTREEIGNAYDNAILYTDYFLARAIDLLRRNSDRFETALFYVSDHGESLGENGVYLHGLPPAIAPREQLHVPALMWFGPGNDDVNLDDLRKNRATPFTHAHIAHTVLGFLEIESAVYRPEMDILKGARPERMPARPARPH